MKNILKINYSFFVISILLLSSVNTTAQHANDSIAKNKRREVRKAYRDSVLAAQLIIHQAEEHYYDSLETIRRVEKLKEFNTQNPDTVFSINLSHLGLKEIPEIKSYNKVKIITLYHNDLTKIRKKDWPSSDSLETIILESNALKKIRFKKNENVKSLNLSNNEFRRIPRSVLRFKNLQRLDLSKNHIKKIPRFIRRMKHLSEINLNHNQLEKLSKRDIRKLRNLASLHIGSNNISSIPENIGVCKRLNTLNMGMNNISGVPPSFACLDRLEHLIFYDNNFDSIPKEVWELVKLKEIDFYKNNLKFIPDDIARLTNLELLFMAYNQLNNIPDTLQSLKKLKALYLHHNEILMIPNWIVGLDHVLYLDFGYNKIFEVPDMSGMHSLKEIDLQENSLSEFPYDLLENKNLTHIYLQGNSFVMTKEERAEMEKLSEELQEIGIRFYF